MKATQTKKFGLYSLVTAALLLGGCATQKQYDYTAFKEARPASILVLPPLNNSPDINASYSMLSNTTIPLAESGYYVFPVTLVDETFKQNGMTSPADIHSLPIQKLRDIFGADAALYINVKKYGTSYMVLSSETRVTVDGKLLDLRSGRVLWEGAATASSAEGDSNNGGLIGMLVKAAVRQIIETVSNQGHVIANVAGARLLAAGRPNGILYGPRSPSYQKDGMPTAR